MEWQGVAPVLVEARDANPKITTAADLRLAQAMLDEAGERAPQGGEA
jgi:2-C-methyl-D-erythritol 4-phosphate cytidylyltransferase